MVNRQTKRKQSKRLQTKKKNYRKKMNKRQKTQKRKTIRGGNFNDTEIAEILPILKDKGFNTLEIPGIMKKLHEGSQAFAGDKLVHLTSQITPLNKQEIKAWIEEVYPDFIADVETDYDSGNDY